MNVFDHNFISAVAGRVGRKADDIHMRLKKWRPGVFGSPIRQRMLQLYRNDGEFGTTVSIPHHLSFLAPDTNINIRYNVAAYDRNGKLIGEKEHLVRHFETLQFPLKRRLVDRSTNTESSRCHASTIPIRVLIFSAKPRLNT